MLSLLALLGAQLILHVSRLGVKQSGKIPNYMDLLHMYISGEQI